MKIVPGMGGVISNHMGLPMYMPEPSFPWWLCPQKRKHFPTVLDWFGLVHNTTYAWQKNNVCLRRTPIPHSPPEHLLSLLMSNGDRNSRTTVTHRMRRWALKAGRFAPPQGLDFECPACRADELRSAPLADNGQFLREANASSASWMEFEERGSEKCFFPPIVEVEVTDFGGERRLPGSRRNFPLCLDLAWTHTCSVPSDVTHDGLTFKTRRLSSLL